MANIHPLKKKKKTVWTISTSHRLNGHEFERAPGVGDGQGSLARCSPWGCKELDMTEWLNWTDWWVLWVRNSRVVWLGGSSYDLPLSEGQMWAGLQSSECLTGAGESGPRMLCLPGHWREALASLHEDLSPGAEWGFFWCGGWRYKRSRQRPQSPSWHLASEITHDSLLGGYTEAMLQGRESTFRGTGTRRLRTLRAGGAFLETGS